MPVVMFCGRIYKSRRYVIFLFVVVILPIISLLLTITLLLKRDKIIYAQHMSYVTSARNLRPRSNIECNAGQLLTNRLRKFGRFNAELNNSFPRQFDSGVLNFSYMYEHTDRKKLFDEEFENYESVNNANTAPYRGYILVLGVGQELSQCTMHLLELCLYASHVRRKVVEPRMQNGQMGVSGLPFGEFFRISSLNKQLLRFGYSELASEEEFKRNCENEKKKILVVFHNPPKKQGRLTGIEVRDVFAMYEKVKRIGWVDCSKEVVSVWRSLRKDQNTADFICMYAEFFDKVKEFNDKVLGDSKCVIINQWNILWKVHWKRLTPPGAPSSLRFLHWYLEPSLEIVNEVNKFRALRIQRPYVAIHIRGVKFKNHTFLQPCFDTALEIVNALRRARKVKTLFLSTDMSEFGGITNKDKDTHQLFAEQSGAVTYDPSIAKGLKNIDRWKVSLTEVRLLSQSDHLIAIGQGSFSAFIQYRYLYEHRNKNPSQWTYTTLCHKTARRYF